MARCRKSIKMDRVILLTDDSLATMGECKCHHVAMSVGLETRTVREFREQCMPTPEYSIYRVYNLGSAEERFELVRPCPIPDDRPRPSDPENIPGAVGSFSCGGEFEGEFPSGSFNFKSALSPDGREGYAEKAEWRLVVDLSELENSPLWPDWMSFENTIVVSQTLSQWGGDGLEDKTVVSRELYTEKFKVSKQNPIWKGNTNTIESPMMSSGKVSSIDIRIFGDTRALQYIEGPLFIPFL